MAQNLTTWAIGFSKPDFIPTDFAKSFFISWPIFFSNRKIKIRRLESDRIINGLTARKPKPAVFERFKTLEFCTRLIRDKYVFHVPLPSPLRMFWVYFTGNVGSLKTHISQQKTKTQKISGETNKNIRKRLGRGRFKNVPIFRVCFSKTAWTSDSERNLGR